MIPALIAPAYNRHDLLERMLRSIDHPVGRGLVLDNAKSGYRLPSMANSGLFDVLKVFEPPFTSLGYGGSINFGILQMPEAPWWLWASNDVVFGPGDLAVIAEMMDTATGPRLVTGGFTWGAVNHAAVDIVGLVDDHNFYPIYFDDNDYHIRCTLGVVEWIEYQGGIVHGADGAKASLTIRSDEKLQQANRGSFGENHRRYLAKWGGEPGHEVFTTPWNSGLPLWATQPDPASRARRLW